MSRDRAVVDDAPALRLLALHHAEGMLGAEKRARQVDSHDIRPLLEGQVFERDAAGADAGIVEQQIDAAVDLLDPIEEGGDRRRIADIGRHHQGPGRRDLRECRGLFEHLAASAGQHHRPAVGEQSVCRSPADAASGPGDDGDFCWRVHISRPPSAPNFSYQ
jgi:hypothetical protein